MYNLGIDMGTSTIKMVLTKDGTVVDKKIKNIRADLWRLLPRCLKKSQWIHLIRINLRLVLFETDFKARVTVTGGNSEVCMQACPQLNLT